MPRLPRWHDGCLPLLSLISSRPITVHGDASEPRADRPTPALDVLLAHGLVELGEPASDGGRLAIVTDAGHARLAAEGTGSPS